MLSETRNIYTILLSKYTKETVLKKSRWQDNTKMTIKGTWRGTVDWIKEFQGTKCFKKGTLNQKPKDL